MSEDLDATARAVIERVSRQGFGAASRADREFFALWCYAGEVDNGGHAQFIFNGSAPVEATAELLTQAGFAEYARLLRQSAWWLAPGWRGFLCRLTRGAVLPNVIDQRLRKLDDAYFASDGSARLYEYLMTSRRT